MPFVALTFCFLILKKSVYFIAIRNAKNDFFSPKIPKFLGESDNFMAPKLQLAVAQCNGGGIGLKGSLPWRIRSEMKHFAAMTTRVSDESKKNAVIMGRKTWESIPARFRPLRNRVNVVLSRTMTDAPAGAELARSLDEAVIQLSMRSDVASLWVIGGAGIYEEAIKSDYCYRVYLTKVLADFECDTFMTPIDETLFKLVEDNMIPLEIQEENGIKWKYEVWEKSIHKIRSK